MIFATSMATMPPKETPTTANGSDLLIVLAILALYLVSVSSAKILGHLT